MNFRTVREAYDLFSEAGIVVLYPCAADMTDADAYLNLDLAKNGAQQFRSLLDTIKESNFLYIDNPLNSFDRRESFCAGYAHGLEKQIFSSNRVENLPLEDCFFIRVLSPREVIEFMRAQKIVF